MVEKHQKGDADSHQPDQFQCFAAAKQCCRHHDRRQQKHGEGVQQPTSEIKQRRQLDNIQYQRQKALVTALFEDHRAARLPDIHRHRKANHEQRRPDRNLDFQNKKGKEKGEKLTGKRQPADVQDETGICRTRRTATPLTRLQKSAQHRRVRPFAFGQFWLRGHLPCFKHQDWQPSGHFAG